MGAPFPANKALIFPPNKALVRAVVRRYIPEFREIYFTTVSVKDIEGWDNYHKCCRKGLEMVADCQDLKDYGIRKGDRIEFELELVGDPTNEKNVIVKDSIRKV